VTVNDSAYNFNDWVLTVQQKVKAIAGDGSIALIGHYKDDTSYYLGYFPQWHLVTCPQQLQGLSATEIRSAYFGGRFSEVLGSMPAEVAKYIGGWNTPKFLALQEEYKFIIDYRKKWDNAPFPPTFVTADAVVITLGHILLVRRKRNPGKGRLALPGGFIKVNETIKDSCVRELREETRLDIGYKELNGSLKMEHVFDHPLRDARGRVITHAFMFELNTKTLPKVQGDDDAAEALWFPLYQIEENEDQFFNDHAQIIKFFVNRMR
jgi:bifunctional NMN adenylyltransferase/nudix hydrolase